MLGTFRFDLRKKIWPLISNNLASLISLGCVFHTTRSSNPQKLYFRIRMSSTNFIAVNGELSSWVNVFVCTQLRSQKKNMMHVISTLRSSETSRATFTHRFHEN